MSSVDWEFLRNSLRSFLTLVRPLISTESISFSFSLICATKNGDAKTANLKIEQVKSEKFSEQKWKLIHLYEVFKWKTIGKEQAKYLEQNFQSIFISLYFSIATFLILHVLSSAFPQKPRHSPEKKNMNV